MSASVVTNKRFAVNKLLNLLVPVLFVLGVLCAIIYFNNFLYNNQASYSGVKANSVTNSSSTTGEADVNIAEEDWGQLEPYKSLIMKYSSQYDLDPALVRALIMHESKGNDRLVSRAGALGLMQCMPGRFAPDEDPFDPQTNIKRGTQYLASMLDRFGTVRLAVAAYNAGPGAVEKYNGIPPYQETRAYVPRVVSSYINYLQ